MVWSQFSIRKHGVHFNNCALDNNNWDKINRKLTKTKKQKKNQFGTECDSLRMGKITVNQIKTMVHRSNIHILNNVKKETEN